jgi:hypothetical protein
MMRHFAAMNIVSEKGEDMYSSSELTDAFTDARYEAGHVFLLV